MALKWVLNKEHLTRIIPDQQLALSHPAVEVVVVNYCINNLSSK